MLRGLSRREFLRAATVAAGSMILASCQPQVVEKVVTKEVERVVKETVVVEKAAQGGAPTAFPTTTLRFGFRAGQKPQVELMVASFQTANPKVNVELEPSPDAEAFQKWQVAAVGGTVPEVLWIGNIVTWSFAQDGIVIDMKPLAEIDPAVPLKDIYDPLVKMCSYKQGFYMVPWAADAPVMYYNKTLFEKAGLPEPPPAGLSVDDFVRSAVAITNEKEQTYGTNINIKWNAIHLAWFSGYGGQYWNNDKSQVLINSPECVAAAQALTDLHRKHKCAVPLNADLGGDPFLLGKVGMTFANRMTSQQLRAVKTAYTWDVSLPVRQPKQHAAITGTMGTAVSKSAKGGKEQVAYALATSILTPAVQRYFARTYMMIPVLKSLAKDPAWYDLPAPPTRKDVFLDVLKIADTLPLPENTYCGTPTFGFMFNTVDQAWDEMLVGGIPPQQALDKAAKLINDCLAKKGQ